MERAQYNCKERVCRGRRGEIPQNQADVENIILYPAVFERCAVSAADGGGEFSIKVWECGVKNGSSVARAITIEGTPHPLLSLSLPSEKINI